MTGRVVDEVLADLVAETAELDARVAGLSEPQWRSPTPAEGWTIAHQIAHLSWTDRAALLAMERPDEFVEQVAALFSSESSPVDAAADEGARQPPAELLESWRSGRQALHSALAAWPDGERIRWFGPPDAPGPGCAGLYYRHRRNRGLAQEARTAARRRKPCVGFARPARASIQAANTSAGDLLDMTSHNG